jgi:hypothetical protein
VQIPRHNPALLVGYNPLHLILLYFIKVAQIRPPSPPDSHVG